MFKRIVFLLIGIFFGISCQAKIYEAASIKEANTWLAEADKDTLIVFDVDYTLIMPENPAFHRPNSWKYLDWIKGLQAQLTSDEWAVYPGIFMFTHPVILVEQELPSLIQDLQKNQFHLMALTASPVGKVGPIPSVEDQREKELRRLEIDFSSQFVEINPMVFDGLLPERGYYPLFKNGVLATNGDKNSKGKVLKAFLDKIEWTPTKIIFIDDKLHYLNSVEEMLSTSEIEFIGIHYRAAEYVPTAPISEEALKKAWKELSHQAKFFANAKNYIVIHAKSHTLEIYNGDSSLVKAYSVGLARNGIGKTQKGDLKTPIGEYHILWKASRYAENDGGFLIIEEKAYMGRDNMFADEPQTDCHRSPIWGDKYGGDQAIFMCLDYPNRSDQANGYTGFGIAIHAALNGIGEDSSAGCIRMTPSDARDLYNRVVEGTTVFIEGD